MRIMIKGGVWKNTEDEILKAAVMKYGKNQWARISSLLVRKSAKQCKARWYEWLDPSIKKTEWTREEDEKLLHLAKLMPTQWRTIAPIVGRTPSQCLERYEKLLDMACSKDENYEPNDDPRKLRPGEIDPNPESKPARPDPVDMDEDEKEMLSEARARLANTRGKKAKRKAREKQLEEARRLASLQKRRELKAAGIDTRQRKRKRRGIDYNAEIPFEKRPPPGFYDASGEDRPVEQPKFPTSIEELEGKRRVDAEAQLRKQDIARNKIAQRQDAPSAILHANKLNDPETVRKRSRLMLPAPQISDQELEEIAKMGYASDLVSGSEDLAEASSATHALLTNYSRTPWQGMTPFQTPQRTPAGKADAIMMEAENLARWRESQTPLLGGENPELHPSDFSGVTPRKREMHTPNPMATPLASPGPTGLATPRTGMTPARDGYSYGATPRGTPFRDDLHINADVDTMKLEYRRQAELRKDIVSGLTLLPQPKNEYQIVIQPISEEAEEAEDKVEEDMSDRMARQKAEEQARQEALLRKRSKVLQRELPRPPAASLDIIRNSFIRGNEDKSSFVPPTLFEQADEMINMELLALLEHESSKYPLEEKTDKERKKGAKRAANGKSAIFVPEIEDFEESELQEADVLIMEEIKFLRVAMAHEKESYDDFVKAHDACQEDLMFFPARATYGLATVASNSEKLSALQNEFDNLKRRMDEEAKKATKIEQKIKVLTHGYQTRSGKLWSQVEATFKQLDTAGTELECFQYLQKQEQLASTYRVNDLIEVVNKQKELERKLQYRYGNLLAEHKRVQVLLQEHRIQLQIQDEIAAKNCALEEEVVAKARALEEQMAVENQVLEEEMSEKGNAAEEQMAVENQVFEKEMAEKQHDVEEQTAVENPVLEEEMAEKGNAVEEQMALENQVLQVKMAEKGDEQMALENHVLQVKMAEKGHTVEEQMAVENQVLQEKNAEKGHTVEEHMAVENHVLEEKKVEKGHAVEEQMTAQNLVVEEAAAECTVIEQEKASEELTMVDQNIQNDAEITAGVVPQGVAASSGVPTMDSSAEVHAFEEQKRKDEVDNNGHSPEKLQKDELIVVSNTSVQEAIASPEEPTTRITTGERTHVVGLKEGAEDQAADSYGADPLLQDADIKGRQNSLAPADMSPEVCESVGTAEEEEAIRGSNVDQVSEDFEQ